jgi:hypothetical protein
VGLNNAVAILDEGEQAVVGEHEELAQTRFSDDGLARGTDAGIDDRDEDRVLGEVRGGAGQEAPMAML